jgi:hypothetical protein
VGSQNWTNIETPHDVRNLLGATSFRAKSTHDPAGRTGLWLLVFLLEVRFAATHAVHLLRGIYEQKEERERARDDCRAIQRQRIDAPEEIVERRRIRFLSSPRAARPAQPLNGTERLFTLESPDHGAKRRGEEANVVVKREIFGPRFWRHG